MTALYRLFATLSLALVMCALVSGVPMPRGESEMHSDLSLRSAELQPRILFFALFCTLPFIQHWIVDKIKECKGAIIGLHNEINPRLEHAANEVSRVSNQNVQISGPEMAIYKTRTSSTLESMGKLCTTVDHKAGTQPLQGELDTADAHMFTIATELAKLGDFEVTSLAPDNAQTLAMCYPEMRKLFNLG